MKTPKVITDDTDAIRVLLQAIGEDIHREGLIDTPKRVLKAYLEMTDGYSKDPAEVLGTTFDVSCDELVIVTGIEFVSLCEHHMLPFTGTAVVGYLPGERVVGLSKLARIVDVYAHRLQVQERLTRQIADAIMEHVGARGVGVIVRGQHACMSCRGVRKRAEMVTSALLGEMRDNQDLRAEFLTLSK
jgi:GTP cyclohydrolase I